MQRALILLNPCGSEAGRHKLKNGLKTQKMHFLPVFELTLASLTAIWVEQNQCPLGAVHKGRPHFLGGEGVPNCRRLQI